MAHADYSCCALCDCKMNYGEDATKEALCVDCIEATMSLKTPCTRVEQVADLLKSMSDAVALAWLHSVGYVPCYYENVFDKYLIERGLVETGVKGAGSWGKRLRAA